MKYINSCKLFWVLCFFFSKQVLAQSLKLKTLNKFSFKEYTINKEKDTINFLIHTKEKATPNKIVVYLQGTSPIPESFFGIHKSKRGYGYTQHFPSDYSTLNKDYAYILIGLPGVPLVKNTKEKLNLNKYHQLNSLDYRVYLADEVIKYVTNNLIKATKVIVYGHSEGAPVAAKLATKNKQITHVGFWGGNALPDFYDFILFEQKENWIKKQSDSVTVKNIQNHIALFNQVATDSINSKPKNTNEITEYTNKRWWSYAEPPLYNLLKINIPLYVQTASHDESAPIESNYLIPLEFTRLHKNNLTFKVCISCDHGFVNKKTNKDHWPLIFKKFINWSNKK